MSTTILSTPQEKERVPLLPVGGEPSSVAESPEPAQEILHIPIFDWRISLPTAIRIGCCAMLCVQNSAYTLMRRYGSGVVKEAASSQSILAVGEIMKLCFSVGMIRKQRSASVDAVEAPENPMDAARWLASTSAPMAVPALIFLAMNLLSFVALRRISASAFTLIQQGKIIATAVLSRVLLGKTISSLRWRALCTLLCAVLIICHQTHPQTAAHACTPAEGQDTAKQQETELAAAEYALGVAAVAVEAVLSGLSNVYFERVLKSTPLTLWERNVQLAMYSLAIYLPYAVWASPANMLVGWSMLTWVTATLGALGGILIGLTLSYCDSVVKNLALSCAIILTALLDHMLFGGPMNLPIAAAAGTIIISILNYTESN